jgi:hypothetical protein
VAKGLEFQALRLSDIDRLKPFFKSNLRRICDSTIGGTFMWRDFFQTEYAVEDGVLYLKVVYLTGETAFAPPRGVMLDHAVTCGKIVDYCDTHGLTPRLCAVSGSFLTAVQQLWPNARYVTDRAWSDYLYDSEDIKTLAGRKYSGQRNHMNKFDKANLGWTFEVVSEQNLAQARAFIESYSREHIKDYPAYDEGNLKTIEVIDNLELYSQVGGILKTPGGVVGAAFGEVLGDTLFVHAEKALTEYQGAYQTLVNCFAREFATEGVKYINREEDDGVLGLRTSKLSYHPVMLLDKYLVEL